MNKHLNLTASFRLKRGIKNIVMKHALISSCEGARDPFASAPETAGRRRLPVGAEWAVSLCSPALLTSSLPAECAQRTGASLIPQIWRAPWDLTKHSSDKDTRSETPWNSHSWGVSRPSVLARRRSWILFFFSVHENVDLTSPLRRLLPPSIPFLSLSLPPLSESRRSKCKPDRWPSSLTWTRLWLQRTALRLKPPS